jgi:hypothetical protein
LTTRRASAFQVNFPHYFLKTSATLSEYLLTREYHLARISAITEKTVTGDSEVRRPRQRRF